MLVILSGKLIIKFEFPLGIISYKSLLFFDIESKYVD